jgi:hypothetical protein
MLKINDIVTFIDRSNSNGNETCTGTIIASYEYPIYFYVKEQDGLIRIKHSTLLTKLSDEEALLYKLEN